MHNPPCPQLSPLLSSLLCSMHEQLIIPFLHIHKYSIKYTKTKKSFPLLPHSHSAYCLPIQKSVVRWLPDGYYGGGGPGESIV